MTTRARKAAALEASIIKWDANAVSETPDQYLTAWIDCPLCLLFYDYGCDGCLVYQKTGKLRCDKAPYYAAQKQHDRWFNDPENLTLRDAAQAAARVEADFLRSLREPKENAE